MTTEGVTPASTSTAPATGAFSVEVPTGLPFGLVVSKVGARTTHHGTRTTTAALAGVALHVTSSQQTSVQYGAVGLTATLGTAVVYVNLVDNLGAPLVGVPTGDITLVDLAGAPVPGVQGPFFFSAIGNLTRNLEQSTAFAGKARVGFLDCPVGSYEIKVNYQNAQNQPQTFTVPVTCAADGLTLAATGDMGGGGGGLMNLTFTADIYPILQRPAINPAGRACAAVGCHNQGGLAPIRFDDLAANVHAAIIARPGVVSLLTPADSLILTKPLYELPPALQNHPNATFLTVEDNDYKKILAWIEQGAPI